MKFLTFLAALSLILLTSCSPDNEEAKDLVENTAEVLASRNERLVAADLGKFFEKDGRRYLYGGDDSTWHFDISNTILKDSQYHYGIGQERFMALIDPEFVSLEEADKVYPDSARFLLLQIDEDVRAYGIRPTHQA